MKKISLFLTILLVGLLSLSVAYSANNGKKSECTTIQSGELNSSTGEVIEVGYDDWGYNYQGHMFNGLYCDAYRDAAWCQSYENDSLAMKWNDAWLSNMDCDGDGLLDRHLGFPSYIGSEAWLTNHMSGIYEENGTICQWTFFVKIVAAPENATVINATWYNSDGVEIGPSIWGEFAITQQVDIDTCMGLHGLTYKSPLNSGLGYY